MEDCLIRDISKISALHEFDYTNGGWIDDGDILLQNWQPGMGVTAVNYCIE